MAAADDPAALQVVTSDSELADRVRAHGAAVVGAGAFRERLDSAMTEAASNGYEVALLDWLGCAARGRQEEAAEAARGVEDRLVFAATSGHVLDFDDTYLPGLAHLSAPVAPAALVLAAELKKSTGDALAAYIRGFEAMGALARASHPALYDRGWHPTAVCGAAGAAVAASHLLDAPRRRSARDRPPAGRRAARRLRLARQVAPGRPGRRFRRSGRAPRARGRAGSARDRRPRLGEGHRRDLRAPAGGPNRAIDENWIKAWPCCLQTHGAIEAAASVRHDHQATDKLTVTVHPVSLQAAAEGPEPADGLQAKFSIPYLTAFTLLHGPPDVESFAQVDPDAVQRAHAIEIKTNSDLLESECVLNKTAPEGQAEIAIVKAALGSPGHPMDPQAHQRQAPWPPRHRAAAHARPRRARRTAPPALRPLTRRSRPARMGDDQQCRAVSRWRRRQACAS